MSDSTAALTELTNVIETLLSPGGCPWDKEQTPLSLSEYLIEETFELVEAIRHGTPADVCEELGDVLFLLLFVARLYAAQERFTLDEALKTNAAKMIRRHPHVFAGEVFESKDAQLKEWERIKRSEKSGKDGTLQGIFQSLPKGLPPLTKSYRIHSKAARAGFTWDTDEDVELQVEAEWLELLDAFKGNDKEKQERELGDMIFTLVELGRRKGIKANQALDGTASRFLNRFSRMERMVAAQGKDFTEVSMEEKNALWDLAKNEEQQADNQAGDSPQLGAGTGS